MPDTDDNLMMLDGITDWKIGVAGVSEALLQIEKNIHDHFKSRIDALERRLAELESNGLKFSGVFSTALSYPRGAVIHHRGAAFIATRNVESGGVEPGNGNTAWHIFAQKGRDISGSVR